MHLPVHLLVHLPAPLAAQVGGQPRKVTHGSGRGGFNLALGSGASSVELTALAIGKAAHGVLMLLGWGVLLPAGILMARYLKWKGPLWYKLHVRLQIAGLLLGVAGLLLALVQFGPFGGAVGGHSALGVVVSVLGIMQPHSRAVTAFHPLWHSLGTAPSPKRQGSPPPASGG